jgi:hypothetical protein
MLAVVVWDQQDFGLLLDYGDGTWRKYRVGTRDEARKEMERLCCEQKWGLAAKK